MSSTTYRHPIQYNTITRKQNIFQQNHFSRCFLQYRNFNHFTCVQLIKRLTATKYLLTFKGRYQPSAECLKEKCPNETHLAPVFAPTKWATLQCPRPWHQGSSNPWADPAANFHASKLRETSWWNAMAMAKLWRCEPAEIAQGVCTELPVESCLFWEYLFNIFRNNIGSCHCPKLLVRLWISPMSVHDQEPSPGMWWPVHVIATKHPPASDDQEPSPSMLFNNLCHNLTVVAPSHPNTSEHVAKELGMPSLKENISGNGPELNALLTASV